MLTRITDSDDNNVHMLAELHECLRRGSRYKLMALYYALEQGDTSFRGSSAEPGRAGRAGPGLNVNERAGPSKRTHRAGQKFRRAGKFRPVQSDL